jgi:hypothetical protein
MLATTALLGLLSFWQTPEAACVAQGGDFVYPALPKSARIQGEVLVGVAIDVNGVPMIETVQGHPMFWYSIEILISSVKFPTSCAGEEVDLRLVYRLIDDGKEGSRATSANEWLIQGVPVANIDYGAARKPWWKRIFGR